MPKISDYFQSVETSVLRMAQSEFQNRNDDTEALNMSIGNVSLPIHPKIKERLFDFKNSSLGDGIVKYTNTEGEENTKQAFLKTVQIWGFDTSNLFTQITDGASQAMQLVLSGCAGNFSGEQKKILVFAPLYGNYMQIAKRLNVSFVFIPRFLDEKGLWSMPSFLEIEKVIEKEKINAILIIPYDNPSGDFLNQEKINEIASLCIKHNLWLISDEAYRGLVYKEKNVSSIWGMDLEKYPEIFGKRISLESASKLWNGCGLRIGALITDNEDFYKKSVAENTANLAPNTIGQYLFSAILEESEQDLRNWIFDLRNFYQEILLGFEEKIKKEIEGVIVSLTKSAIYLVLDFRNVIEDFDSKDFVFFCAKEGRVSIDKSFLTFLACPMEDFYGKDFGYLGKTQIRVALVLSKEKNFLAIKVLGELLRLYKEKNGKE